MTTSVSSNRMGSFIALNKKKCTLAARRPAVLDLWSEIRTSHVPEKRAA